MVRDLTFVSPIKIKMGPPQTLCNQTQRYQVRASWLPAPEAWRHCDLPAVCSSLPACRGGLLPGGKRFGLCVIRLLNTHVPPRPQPQCGAAPVAAAYSPSCPQVYAGDHLVFETSQVQLDIPYG